MLRCTGAVGLLINWIKFVTGSCVGVISGRIPAAAWGGGKWADRVRGLALTAHLRKLFMAERKINMSLPAGEPSFQFFLTENLIFCGENLKFSCGKLWFCKKGFFFLIGKSFH